MRDAQDADDVIRRLVQWADRQTAVRAMLLISTRAIPHAMVDALSDYDVILVTPDIQPLVADRSWLADFGEVLAAYWDPILPDRDTGFARSGSVTQYAEGLKIDFTL